MFRYWLYAAVRYKSLLVTNDEMRDHIFELLGNDFFPKWKERHQVCPIFLEIQLNCDHLFCLPSLKLDASIERDHYSYVEGMIAGSLRSHCLLYDDSKLF